MMLNTYGIKTSITGMTMIVEIPTSKNENEPTISESDATYVLNLIKDNFLKYREDYPEKICDTVQSLIESSGCDISNLIILFELLKEKKIINVISKTIF
jgi:uncharacterized protein YyaL (SSP411 family)